MGMIIDMTFCTREEKGAKPLLTNLYNSPLSKMLERKGIRLGVDASANSFSCNPLSGPFSPSQLVSLIDLLNDQDVTSCLMIDPSVEFLEELAPGEDLSKSVLEIVLQLKMHETTVNVPIERYAHLSNCLFTIDHKLENGRNLVRLEILAQHRIVGSLKAEIADVLSGLKQVLTIRNG
jgi:hypothetical protein